MHSKLFVTALYSNHMNTCRRVKSGFGITSEYDGGFLLSCVFP